jgi:hypothetical protein
MTQVSELIAVKKQVTFHIATCLYDYIRGFDW